jgi:hypothetical protein
MFTYTLDFTGIDFRLVYEIDGVNMINKKAKIIIFFIETKSGKSILCARIAI